jgi:hypothetical protein
MKGIDDFKVVLSDQAKSALEDSGGAEAIRDMIARLRQALAQVDPSDPEAVAAAMREFGAVPADEDDFPEDDHGDGEERDSDGGR